MQLFEVVFLPVTGWLYSTYRWPVLYQAEAVSLKWRDGVKYRMNEIQPSEAKMPQALSAKKRLSLFSYAITGI